VFTKGSAREDLFFGGVAMGSPGERRRAAGVFITDASPMVCHLMASALQRSRYRLNVLGFSSDSEGTLSAFAQSKTKVDVAVISSHLREGTHAGLKLTRKIRASHPNTRIIALLDGSDRAMVVEAFRSGCSGIFSREQPFEKLCKCIRVVQEGQVWAASREIEFVLDALTYTESSPAGTTSKNQNGWIALTSREQGLVRLVAEGLTNRDISRQLNLSEHTVRNYLFRIFNKVGTSNRIELALYAIHHGQTGQEETRQAG
jgi:two-component system, NarL family, nitrate/nitrite response regulator NarL